jgi:hypothetical protein
MGLVSLYISNLARRRNNSSRCYGRRLRTSPRRQARALQGTLPLPVPRSWQVMSIHAQQLIYVTIDLLAISSRRLQVGQESRSLYACGILKRKCGFVCSRFPGRQLLRLHMRRGFGVTRDAVMIGGVDDWAQRVQKGGNDHLSDENSHQQLCSAKQNRPQAQYHARGVLTAMSSRLRGLKCDERCMSAKPLCDTRMD